jgi:hypothetical protein
MWEYNIKMGFREIELGGTGWIYLAQEREQWRAREKTAVGRF